MTTASFKRTASSASHAVIGAPAQPAQSSRKGKRAWRKNVDIRDVEDGLEDMRVEERTVGSKWKDLKDEEIFVVDVEGDEHVRKALPRFSRPQLLASSRALALRSAVPAIHSRKRKGGPAIKGEKRLSALSSRSSGSVNTEQSSSEALYDPWAQSDEQGKSTSRKVTTPLRTNIDCPAVETPHEGTSYNPPVTSYQTLLSRAHEIEVKRTEEEAKLVELRDKLNLDGDAKEGASGMMVDACKGAAGMTVDVCEGESEETEQDGEIPVKKIPERQTKQQRRKAEKIRARKRALATKEASQRRLNRVKSVEANRLRKVQPSAAALKSRLKGKRGIEGMKLGKHRVPVSKVDVQLGEDLSESLRGLKPEGNLFRDRLISLQQRALVEPRALILAKCVKKVKEYEKHAWKRFDREN